jgi:hypothetical protein
MATKICSKCGIEKNISEFYERIKGSKDGYNAQCKICVNNRSKQYIQNHPGLNAKSQRKYRKNNIEKCIKSGSDQRKKRLELNLKSECLGKIDDLNRKCSKCGIIKSISEFSKDKKYEDGLDSQCKICKRKKTKDWVLKNLDHINKYSREYLKNNPEIRNKKNKKSAISKFNNTVSVIGKVYNINTCPEEIKPLLTLCLTEKKLKRTLKKLNDIGVTK